MKASEFNSMIGATEQVSAIDQQLKRVNDQCDQLESLIVRLADRLNPVLTPIPTCAAVAGECAGKSPSQSPKSYQIGCIAETLEANANVLRSLLDRLEV